MKAKLLPLFLLAAACRRVSRHAAEYAGGGAIAG